MQESVNITIDGVGLKMNPGGVDFYPDEIAPYDHQIRMAEIMSSNDDYIAVNTAPTGGGKTWSWAVPVIEKQMTALAVLPTNALITDQKSAIEEYKEQYTDEGYLEVLSLTGRTTTDLKRKWGVRTKGEAISEEVKLLNEQNKSVIVLTNPDIFTILRGDKYQSALAKASTAMFDAVVFDEFHLADTKGWNSILYLVDEMYASKNTLASKFVFLSATPDEDIEYKLKNSMSVPNYANCTAETKRDAPDSPGRLPWSESAEKENWAAVMPPVDVEFRPNHTFRTGGHLLSEECAEETLDFVDEGRTVIMLDSLREIDYVHPKIESSLSDKEIYRIDGFHKNSMGYKLENFDTLVSNSAVEVGIDFDVDQVIMSGYTKKRFLQRLGRLRNRDNTLRAIAYVPERVYDALTRAKKMYGDHPLPRDHLRRQLYKWFPEPKSPDSYPEKYSALESLIHAKKKMDNMTPQRRQEYKPEAYKRIYNHFYMPKEITVTPEHIQKLNNKAESPLNNKSGKAFYETITSYRNSGINTLVYKKNEDEVLSYNLFYPINSGDIRFVKRSEFYEQVPNKHHTKAKSNESNSIGFCIYYGPLEQDEDDDGRFARLSATNNIREITQLDPTERTPISTKGLTISVDDYVPGLELLNKELAKEELLCYPLEGNSYDIQQMYNLDKFFFVRDLTDLRGNYSVAMGVNALYLHCHVQEIQKEINNSSMKRLENC